MYMYVYVCICMYTHIICIYWVLTGYNIANNHRAGLWWVRIRVLIDFAGSKYQEMVGILWRECRDFGQIVGWWCAPQVGLGALKMCVIEIDTYQIDKQQIQSHAIVWKSAAVWANDSCDSWLLIWTQSWPSWPQGACFFQTCITPPPKIIGVKLTASA